MWHILFHLGTMNAEKAPKNSHCLVVMHQLIPAVPIPPPGQPWGICSRCQSRGWGIRSFIAAPEAGH